MKLYKNLGKIGEKHLSKKYNPKLNSNHFGFSCTCDKSSNIFHQFLDSYIRNNNVNSQPQSSLNTFPYSSNASISSRFVTNSKKINKCQSIVEQSEGKLSKLLSTATDKSENSKLRLHTSKNSYIKINQELKKELPDSPCPESPERHHSKVSFEESGEGIETKIVEISTNPENFSSCEIEEHYIFHKIPEIKKGQNVKKEFNKYNKNADKLKTNISKIPKKTKFISKKRTTIKEKPFDKVFDNSNNIDHKIKKRNLSRKEIYEIRASSNNISKSMINKNFFKTVKVFNNDNKIKNSSVANQIFVSLYSTMHQLNQNSSENSNYSTMRDEILYLDGNVYDNLNFKGEKDVKYKDSILSSDLEINEEFEASKINYLIEKYQKQ